MRCALLALALVAACDADAGNNPLNPGGGGPGTGTPGPDAGAPDAQGGAAITGIVCQMQSLLNPACAVGGGLANVRVAQHFDDDATQTAADGSFVLQPSVSDSTALRAAEGDAFYRSTLARYPTPGGSASNLTIPVLSEDDYLLVKARTGFPEQVGTDAAIVAYIVDSGGAPVVGAIVTPSVAADVYYDDDDPTQWRQDRLGTGLAGAALITAVPATTQASVSLSVDVADTQFVATDIPVAADTLSLVTITAP